MNNIEELFEDAINQLVKTSKPLNPIETWRIKVDGVFIITRSKKTVWKKINHAKSALRLHFESVNFAARGVHPYNYREFGVLYEKVYQTFLKERVEFVKL
jgi:hypothetical protein